MPLKYNIYDYIYDLIEFYFIVIALFFNYLSHKQIFFSSAFFDYFD